MNDRASHFIANARLGRLVVNQVDLVGISHALEMAQWVARVKGASDHPDRATLLEVADQLDLALSTIRDRLNYQSTCNGGDVELELAVIDAAAPVVDDSQPGDAKEATAPEIGTAIEGFHASLVAAQEAAKAMLSALSQR